MENVIDLSMMELMNAKKHFRLITKSEGMFKKNNKFSQPQFQHTKFFLEINISGKYY